MSLTSSFSSTNIGHGTSNIERQREVQQMYKSEACSILNHLASGHPSRSNRHMQVQYPDTIARLKCTSPVNPYSTISNTNTSRTQDRKPDPLTQKHTQSHTGSRISNKYIIEYIHISLIDYVLLIVEAEKEFYARRSQETKNESSLNNSKLRYNRDQGQKAIVNEVIISFMYLTN